jgi:hypothetical protein
VKNKKEKISIFALAENISAVLEASGLSKAKQREALSLVSSHNGCRLVPFGYAVGTVLSAGNASPRDIGRVPSSKKKGPSKKQKNPRNSDPAVATASKRLQGIQKDIKEAKAAGKDPEALGLIADQVTALADLKSAKAVFDLSHS